MVELFPTISDASYYAIHFSVNASVKLDTSTKNYVEWILSLFVRTVFTLPARGEAMAW